MHSLERAFGLHGLADGSLLRQGLGFPGAAAAAERELEFEHAHEDPLPPERNAYIIPLDDANPAQNDRIVRAYVDEARLHQDLRSAGLL